MSHLSLSIIAANRIAIATTAAATAVCRRSRFPKLFYARSVALGGTAMADKSSKKSWMSVKKGEGKEKLPGKLPPPPPEKPLPGDCCGSGCVRCVWDVYYEELEAYNKLLAESKSNCHPEKAEP